MSKFLFHKKGFTLTEMLVTLTILAILATAIMPLAKTAVKREKEIEL
ncbi:MAG: type II secretion system protein, partial [Candidatus Aminicenantaceae bacterium]